MVRKIIFTAVFVFIAAAGAFADEIFFPTKKGVVLLMANLDAKGKVDSYGRTTVKDVRGSGGDLTITCAAEVLNKKRQPEKNTPLVEYTVKVVNGAMTLDVISLLKMPVVDGATIVLTGDTLRLPSKLKPGDRLNDAKMTMTVDMGVIKMATDIAITDFKCLAVESVTVPAGTFEAYKTTQAVAITNSMVKVTQTMTVVSWNVLGVGAVKNVVTDEAGKVQSTSELHEITR